LLFFEPNMAVVRLMSELLCAWVWSPRVTVFVHLCALRHGQFLCGGLLVYDDVQSLAGWRLPVEDWSSATP
jgi:hypothetical protein